MGESAPIVTESVELLVFKYGDILVGADMEQVSSIVSVEDAESAGVVIVNLPAVAGDSKKVVLSKDSSKVLLIKNSINGNKVRGLVIERLEDIFNTNLESLMPLPPLLEKSKARDVFWVVANVGTGKLSNVLVADLYGLK